MTETELTDEGYIDVTQRNGKVVALLPMLYTWAVVVGIGRHGYECRYCYATLTEARGALNDWKDGEIAPNGFIVKKG